MSSAHGNAQQVRPWSLGDESITATISGSKGHLGTIHIKTGRGQMATLSEAFAITLNDGTVVKASNFSLEGLPRPDTIDLTSKDQRAAGSQLCTALKDEKTDLKATWCLLQPAGAHYMRQTLSLDGFRPGGSYQQSKPVGPATSGSSRRRNRLGFARRRRRYVLRL